MRPQSNRYYTHIKPFLKNKYVQSYSGIVFSIITITIFTLFAIKPTISTIVSLQKSVEEQKQTLEKLKKNAETLTLTKNNYEALPQESRDNMESLIPNSTSLPDLISNITTLITLFEATSSGMQIEAVDLDGVPEKLNRAPIVKEVNFLVNIQGSYTQLSTLLDKLSKSPRLISIKSVNFNKPPDSNNLTVSLNAKGFYLKN